ncbi:MAG TPA: TIGR03435 family protein [Bryobacteraceae bacterium]|nr:TIGR03435 family protein [Bryobacteraceae bacterium]
MRRILAVITAAGMLAGLALSQTADSKPKFELADIHPAANTTGVIRFGGRGGNTISSARYELRNASLLDLISNAYGMDSGKVIGGPTWLEWDHYDLTAKVAADAHPDPETLKLMLQDLLAERFHLAVHKDKKDLQAYTLTAGKTPKLKQSDGSSGDTGCRGQIGGPGATQMPGGGIRINSDAGPIFQNFTCHNITMDEFAKLLTNQVSQNGITNPVENKTGLDGKWDFDYRTSLQIRILLTTQPSDNITIFDAVEKQLGLRLNSVQLAQDVLIVDKAERPTPNAAGVTEALALKIPAEFEVADVRPVEPAPGPRRVQITRGGGVNFSAMQLRNLITSAYAIDDNRLIAAPSMTDALNNLYSIVARPPASTAPAPDSAPQGPMLAPFASPDDSDAAWTMMRSLLKDRFKLAMHQEDRVLTAWKLVAVKPKMKKADPAERTKTNEGPGPDGKDPRNTMPARQRLAMFQNVTMDQFAERIPQIAGGYISTPVINATGLDGGYDFTINFSYPFALRGGPGRGGADAAGGPAPSGEAAEPTGAISFPDALAEQLGLKLVEDKRPVSVWVIDHVESKPTDN